ncbi:Crp/Fnr family transcriptional regulator [Ancylomarina euxinus]|uniref:Crp/Fnr family transcriptional regulator n=1 Tax=Ancylomarina euxinus TaxID=2283627 RepID=A0A425Y7P3_9BACT|nr:Crp/Fnr family transcriptional regulator [Ancylomarina euxinus]MCZ4693664.1 Crp/Fnr family transcriptional regulator [Ancylomarina euxinus]MUP13893.1 helix-turn-helix domain-containing protein [Ancylomarina euxinus]RRG24478.1 Crp/Fnr family transcriptional regulator [Ancylomarina euxinus]
MNQNQTFPNCDQLAECFAKTFKHLSSDQMNLLFWEEECELLKRGKVIYAEGDSARGCYFVYSGVLKVFKTGLEGKEQIIRFAKSGDIIGFRSALSQEPACTSSKVIEDAIVCFIPSDTLTKLIQQNPDFSLELIKMTCKELGQANSYITDIAQKSVRERLAEVLMQLMETFGLAQDNTLQISLTREELANMVGTATESVIRLLSEFKNDGLIEIKGRKIKIVDVRSLKRVGGVY